MIYTAYKSLHVYYFLRNPNIYQNTNLSTVVGVREYWSYFGNIRFLSKQVHKQNINARLVSKYVAIFPPHSKFRSLKKEAGTKNVRGRQLSVSKRARGWLGLVGVGEWWSPNVPYIITKIIDTCIINPRVQGQYVNDLSLV